MQERSKVCCQIRRLKGLNALRGIGITGIVLYHLFPSIFRGGFLGVPLFFVLSGYLMFTTSENNWKNGEFSIGHYYKKRILKILPPLFTMVMAVCCYMTLTQSSLLIGMRQEIFSIFLGYENWWQIGRHASYFTKLANASPFTHLWFLAVEIQFYLFWPLLFLLYKQACQILSGRKICFCFLLLALLSAGKMMLLYTPGADPSRVYYGTDTMAFPLLIGIFLGALRNEYHLPPIRAIKNVLPLYAGFAGILAVLFFAVDGQNAFLYQGGMFLISLFFAGVIYLLTEWEEPVGQQLDASFFSFLGKRSYNIYLWHYPIIVLALL